MWRWIVRFATWMPNFRGSPRRPTCDSQQPARRTVNTVTDLALTWGMFKDLSSAGGGRIVRVEALHGRNHDLHVAKAARSRPSLLVAERARGFGPSDGQLHLGRASWSADRWVGCSRSGEFPKVQRCLHARESRWRWRVRMFARVVCGRQHKQTAVPNEAAHPSERTCVPSLATGQPSAATC